MVVCGGGGYPGWRVEGVWWGWQGCMQGLYERNLTSSRHPTESSSVCVCVCVCVRACVRARVCVRACVRAVGR